MTVTEIMVYGHKKTARKLLKIKVLAISGLLIMEERMGFEPTVRY